MAEESAKIRKRSGNNTIVLITTGEYYKAVDESARNLHAICNTRLISCGSISYTYFQSHDDYWVFPKLIREGFKLCIIDSKDLI